VTTSFIMDEALTFLSSRGLHAKAVDLGDRLLTSPSIQFVHVDESLFREAWQYLVRHRDKTYSLTDCTSFVLMQKRGIRAALTFDNHFAQAGFVTQP
jgi:uncharacterized protein